MINGNRLSLGFGTNAPSNLLNSSDVSLTINLLPFRRVGREDLLKNVPLPVNKASAIDEKRSLPP